MTINEAAAALQVTRRTVFTMLKDGRLTRVGQGKRVRVDPDSAAFKVRQRRTGALRATERLL
jgi:excisionase family DNA binding protein